MFGSLNRLFEAAAVCAELALFRPDTFEGAGMKIYAADGEAKIWLEPGIALAKNYGYNCTVI